MTGAHVRVPAENPFTDGPAVITGVIIARLKRLAAGANQSPPKSWRHDWVRVTYWYANQSPPCNVPDMSFQSATPCYRQYGSTAKCKGSKHDENAQYGYAESSTKTDARSRERDGRDGQRTKPNSTAQRSA